MAIASPTTPSFSASFCWKRSSVDAFRLSTRFPSAPVALTHRTRPRLSLSTVARLNSSKSSGADGFVSPDNGNHEYELQHGFPEPPEQKRSGLPVFVTLPVDTVGPGGLVKRKKTMLQSFKALAAAGVEGVVMEVWWGLVERTVPGIYDWDGYLEIVGLASRCGLKIRAVLAFHQCGFGPGDPLWIPLPQWVLEEMYKDPDLSYSDRFGRRNMECVSLGCDNLLVLRGRSPIQVYADIMRNFRDTFKPFLGAVITGIQVGMGPDGELRYPSYPSQRLAWPWRSRELGEFQCYDKYMLASLDSCAQGIGMHDWGNRGPVGVGNSRNDHENTEFFKSVDGSWNTPYGRFFLQWYSGMLLLHGERICREAETIFRGIEVNTSGKVAGIHWHYRTESHPSELTAGYYNTSIRDGCMPIARMFGKYRFTLCCTGFEMEDEKERHANPVSSPEGFLRQLLSAARICNIPVEGENTVSDMGDKSFEQVLKMIKFYASGLENPRFSFNFMRMDRDMFKFDNWFRFTRFVKQMSEANIFRSKLDFEGDIHLSSISNVGKSGVNFAHCRRRSIYASLYVDHPHSLCIS